jgi:hypothetical protein
MRIQREALEDPAEAEFVRIEDPRAMARFQYENRVVGHTLHLLDHAGFITEKGRGSTSSSLRIDDKYG